MRLWTVHPQYLDAKGLVALWREALLAQKVLAGETRGYTRHPQLTRFRQHAKPVPMIATYLRVVADEAARRGYQFDKSKICQHRISIQVKETRGQLLYEWAHLKRKLRARSPEVYRKIRRIALPGAHPLFQIVEGQVRDWEKIATVKTKRYRTSTSIGKT